MLKVKLVHSLVRVNNMEMSELIKIRCSAISYSGFDVFFLCFQDVYDKLDYLSSLGKTQTAAVQRDADIGVAEAERDAGIRV